MAKSENITHFDGVAENEDAVPVVRPPPLWGSARLCYTICAFLAMVIQLCLRNTLNFVILCMVKPQPVDNSTISHEFAEADNQCGAIDTGSANSVQRVSGKHTT